MDNKERKYVAFTHSFNDPWLGEAGEDVTLTFHFAKPTRLEVKRLQDKAVKDSAQAARNLLLDVVRPEDKQGLLDAMDEYPGIATSFSTAVIRGVGISADLGN